MGPMNRLNRIGLALCIVLLSGVAFGQGSANPAKANGVTNGKPQPLTLLLTCNKSEVSTDDPVVLTVQLLNGSSDSISVFGELKWGYGGGLMLNVSDEKGNPTFSEQHDDDMIVPSRIADSSAYVVVPPDHLFGVVRSDTPKNLFRTSGRYKISVRYWSPISERQAKRKGFWEENVAQ